MLRAKNQYHTSKIQVKNITMDNAEFYYSAHTLQIRDASEIISEFYGGLCSKIGERVLDVGCGPGYVTSQLLSPVVQTHGGSVLGVDVSHSMVKFAKKVHENSHVSFQQLDIVQEITEETKKRLLGNAPGFDKIFSSYCLHWVSDLRQAFVNMNQLLRPGGEILLLFLGTCPLFTVYEILSQKPRWKPYMKDVKRFVSPYHNSEHAVEELERLLKSTGFEIRSCESRVKTFVFDSIEMLRDSVIAVNPFLERITSDCREDFIRDCVSESLNLVAAESTHKSYQLNRVKYNLLVVHVIKTACAALSEVNGKLYTSTFIDATEECAIR